MPKECFFFQSPSWKRHGTTHWRKQLGRNCYQQWQISQSDCGLAATVVKYHSFAQLLRMFYATDHLDIDFSTASKKIPHYSAELVGQMAYRFIALYAYHCMFVHVVVKLSISNKFFSNRWLPYFSINMMSTHSWCKREGFQWCLLMVV